MTDRQPSAWVLFLIALDKLVKAAFLLIIAIEVHKFLLAPDAAERLEHWFHMIRVDPRNHYVHDLIASITGISEHQLNEIRVGSYLYAGLDLIEGIGLMLKKRWAEYLTTISTALFLPLEIYEIFNGHHHVAKIVVFFLNLAIVVYLIMRLRRQLRVQSTV